MTVIERIKPFSRVCKIYSHSSKKNCLLLVLMFYILLCLIQNFEYCNTDVHFKDKWPKRSIKESIQLFSMGFKIDSHSWTIKSIWRFQIISEGSHYFGTVVFEVWKRIPKPKRKARCKIKVSRFVKKGWKYCPIGPSLPPSSEKQELTLLWLAISNNININYLL